MYVSVLLLLRAVSGLVVMRQLGAVLMSMTCETREGHVCGLCCILQLSETMSVAMVLLHWNPCGDPCHLYADSMWMSVVSDPADYKGQRS